MCNIKTVIELFYCLQLVVMHTHVQYVCMYYVGLRVTNNATVLLNKIIQQVASSEESFQNN